MAQTKEMAFWTDGKSFTNLFRNFFIEGRFLQCRQIIESAPLCYQKLLFKGNAHFIGDTRTEEGLCIEKTVRYDDWEKDFTTGLLQIISEIKYIKAVKLIDENLQVLKLFFEEDFIRKRIVKLILERKGFKVVPPIKAIESGVILEDGTLIECGYQQHNNLYVLLNELDLGDYNGWLFDKKTIAISSRKLVGKLSYTIETPEYEDLVITKQQKETLFAQRHNVKVNFDSRTLMKSFHIGYMDSDTGAKVAGLMLLKDFYKNVNTPMISDTPIEGVRNCLRTSLEYPLPGIIDSSFNDVSEQAKAKIYEQWQKVKHLKRGNTLHLFYQEYLEGINGVAFYGENGFSYAASKARGEVVSGGDSNYELPEATYQELKCICSALHKDFAQPVQLEFVLTENGLYVVEFKLLKNLAEKAHRNYPIKTEDVLFEVDPFTKGRVEISSHDEILIVDTDCSDSAMLIGKKALLVRRKIEFSHILALSAMLGIPSAIIGDIKLPISFVLDTNDMDGYILKLENKKQ